MDTSEMVKKWAKYDHTGWKLPTTRFALYLTQFSTVLLESFFKLKLESRKIFSLFLISFKHFETDLEQFQSV